MRIKLKYIIGSTLIILGLILKSLLTHNIDYWGIVKTWTILLFTFGQVFIFLDFLMKLDNKPKTSFRGTPLKWIIRATKIAAVLIISVAITVGFENVGIKINQKLRTHYLSFDTAKAEGTIIGIKSVPYTIKYTSHKRFYLIEYKVGERTIQQGLDYDDKYYQRLIQNKTIVFSENMNRLDILNINNRVGVKLNIVYSKKYPSFLRIDE